MRLKKSAKSERGLRLYNEGRGFVPSVSEILKTVEKSYLDLWRQRVGREEADKTLKNASVFGTRLHAAAQQVAWGEDAAVDPEIQPYAAAVRKFLDQHVAEVIGTEIQLVSKRPRFGGTLDLYCKLKDQTYAVVDWKTSTSLTREHGLQTVAYALLCREHGMKVNRRLVVRIKKESPGKFYARLYRNHEADVEAFLALRNYWWWQHKAAMKKREAKGA